jgi:hypothetical protein
VVPLQPYYGLLAEFTEPEDLVAAARAVHEQGYIRAEAYSPYPVEGLSESLGFTRSRLPLLVLIGAFLGGIGGYCLQYWVAAVEYPLNIGGRPLNSWPAFIPITFECTILVAALFAVLGMLALNGLPQPHHPLFNVPEFAAYASTDRFFLAIRSDDPQFHETRTRQLLEDLKPMAIYEVPWV